MEKSLRQELPAIWRLGFRPFFFLAGVAAVALVGLWLAVLFGLLAAPAVFPNPVYWHAHEMLFGFAAAALVGFLLTASQNWTGIPGINGRRLELLAALWALGRLAAWLFPRPHPAYAALDLAFLPTAGCFLSAYLGRAGQGHNRGFLGVIALLTVGNLLVHLDALGVLPGLARRGLMLGLDALILVILVIGGRVIPMFTRNALPTAKVRPATIASRAVLGLAVAFTVSDAALGCGPVTGTLAAAAAVAAVVRMLLWDPWSTWRRPMLWILFKGYGWLVLGFALRAAAGWAPVQESLGIHAQAVGGIGVLICGMMPRVSLGHTGRKIQATPALVASFVLVNVAVFARVVLAGLLPAHYRDLLVVAGSAWILAFLLFLGAIAPYLFQPRADGRPG